jgi:hypothetical protein
MSDERPPPSIMCRYCGQPATVRMVCDDWADGDIRLTCDLCAYNELAFTYMRVQAYALADNMRVRPVLGANRLHKETT